MRPGTIPLSYISIVVLVGSVAPLAGCVAPGAAPNWPPQVTDPSWLSPYSQPLYRPPGESQDPARPGGPGLVPVPEDGGLPPAPVPLPLPEDLEAPPEIDELPSGPSLVPPGTADTAHLQLTVDAPPHKQVGSGATFRLTVRNAGSGPVGAVVVESRFDEPLAFPGSAEKIVRRDLGRLSAGESREVALTLVGERPGRWCAEFAVTVGGREAVWKSVCVEFVPRQIDVGVVGPPVRTVGSRAEFTVKLVNVSSDELRDVRVGVAYDAVLEPKEGTRGAKTDPGRLTWAVGRLKAGEGIQLQVEFECRAASQQACVTAEVTGTGFPAERVEGCLPIVPVRGPLDVQVLDTRDPLAVGETTEFVVTVRNVGLEPARAVRVSASLPETLEIAGTAVLLGGERLPIKADARDRRIEFEPVDVPAADAVLTVRIRVKASSTGDGRFVAEVTESRLGEPIEVVEPTTINPAPDG